MAATAVTKRSRIAYPLGALAALTACAILHPFAAVYVAHSPGIGGGKGDNAFLSASVARASWLSSGGVAGKASTANSGSGSKVAPLSSLVAPTGRDVSASQISSPAPDPVRKSVVESAPKDGDTGNVDGRGVRIFIAVKTSAQGAYRDRIAQLRGTWLRDALEASDDVDVRFFVGRADLVGSSGDAGGSNFTAAGGGGEDSDIVDPIVGPLLVTLPSCADDEKRCKTFGSFRYFLERSTLATSPSEDGARHRPFDFFCNFDDDTYVVVPTLLRVLSKYLRNPPNYGHNLYVGRQSFPGGLYGGRIHFHTGAAYCLSADLLHQGAPHFDSIVSGTTLADDVAVGEMVGNRLNVTLVDDERFHSHLEILDQHKIPRDDLADQVSFGYNNRWKGTDSFDSRFVDVPRLFSKGDDSMMFRSLRCFLLRRWRGGEGKRAREEYESKCRGSLSTD